MNDPARGGLLAVHAHPDDETLATGALLATWAATGEPVTVVTCTRGEEGEVIARPGSPTAGLATLEGDGPALAAHRETELAGALAHLGVRDHVFLDTVPDPAQDSVQDSARYTDSGMAWAAPGIARSVAAASLPPGAFVAVPLDEAAARLAAVVRSRRPRVVVTYEPGGGYGHPDHVRTSEVTSRALQLLAEAGDDLPELWHAVLPDDVARVVRRRLAASTEVRELLRSVPYLTLPDLDGVLPPLVVPAEQLGDVVRVDVGPVAGAVVAAMRAHATQVQHATCSTPDLEGPGSQDGPLDGREDEGMIIGWYALSNDVLAPIGAHEYYVVRTPRPPRTQETSSDPQYR
ncbi:PIG-L family deacetylase [Oerskovia flava]|uniref:PIG-L family deacetylase n=1 Tax=Oerskovia flava TaxID=2986422 RepID=UPI002240295C|nr:PIG-L family deacetylase [Oerskovia sp. JB1-3-2]